MSVQQYGSTNSRILNKPGERKYPLGSDCIFNLFMNLIFFHVWLVWKGLFVWSSYIYSVTEDHIISGMDPEDDIVSGMNPEDQPQEDVFHRRVSMFQVHNFNNEWNHYQPQSPNPSQHPNKIMYFKINQWHYRLKNRFVWNVTFEEKVFRKLGSCQWLIKTRLKHQNCSFSFYQSTR